MTTYCSSPALGVPTDPEEASGPRAKEVIGLTLFKSLSPKVEFDLFFENESLIISVVGLIATTPKTIRQPQVNKEED